MSEPSVATASAEKSASLWEDFIDVLYAPSSVFARRRDGSFGGALLILTILSAAVFFATRPLTQPMFDRMFDAQTAAMESNPAMSAEQKASARAMTERISTIFVPIGAIVGTPILVLISGALVWGVASLFGAKVSYGQAATVATYANVPRVLGGVATAVVLLVKDAQELPVVQGAITGPVLFLSRDASPMLVALMSRLDVFTIWATVLVGIGVAVVARTTRSRGLTIAGVVWLIAGVWAVFGALRQAAAMG